MNKSISNLYVMLFAGILLGFLVLGAFAQEANAPVYKDGDWWKVKVERSGGVPRSGFCQDDYSEYVIKIEQGKPQAYGLKDSNEVKIDCPVIVNQVLGAQASGSETPEPLLEFLRFPLRVGQTWTPPIGQKSAEN